MATNIIVKRGICTMTAAATILTIPSMTAAATILTIPSTTIPAAPSITTTALLSTIIIMVWVRINRSAIEWERRALFDFADEHCVIAREGVGATLRLIKTPTTLVKFHSANSSCNAIILFVTRL